MKWILITTIFIVFCSCNVKKDNIKEDCYKYYEISTAYFESSYKSFDDNKKYSDSMRLLGKYWQRKADSLYIEIKKQSTK